MQIDITGRLLRHEFTEKLTYLTPKRDALRQKKDFSDAKKELEFSVATICDVLLENMFRILDYMEQSKALTTNDLQLRKAELEKARPKVPKSSPEEREISYKIAITEWAIDYLNPAGRNAFGQLLELNDEGISKAPAKAKPIIPTEWVDRVEYLMGLLNCKMGLPSELKDAPAEIEKITKASKALIRRQLENGTATVEALEHMAEELTARANSGRATPERKDVLLWQARVINVTVSDFKWGNERDYFKN